ncbi:MAG: plasmid stabilization protein [Micrococcus sp.]|nr:plasmid stabilization protein [Micrococcus sp.]
MAIPTISNVPEDVHRALRTQAEQHGCSTEAEVREILAVAFKPENRVLVGDALAAIGRKSGLTDEDFAILESVRDRTPAEPPRFE